MKRISSHTVIITLTVWFLLVSTVDCPAWVGLELDGKFTGIDDPYGATGVEGSGSLWELSGRVMYLKSFGTLDTEFHWLGQLSQSTGVITLSSPSADTAFRSLNLEKVHHEDDKSSIFSEIDRLSLRWNPPGASLTAGRQAVSWGEAFYFNVGDLFGAFPVTETNRRYKPGIDAVSAVLNLGPFSELSLVEVPAEEGDDSVAAHLLFSLGPGTLSLTGGRILNNDKSGAGYTVDVGGTQLYSTLLFTRTRDDEEYSQMVVGAQRQTGPNTFVIGEFFRNGWGTTDPDQYPKLMLTDESRYGQALTLGRYNTALQISQQISPLMTLTPAIFSNLSDGSALLRIDGNRSLSDLTDISGGLILGVGARPDNGIPGSEYGGVPISIYLEVVHSI